MVNQKLISFKIDESLLPLIDMLCDEYGMNRNNMLNVLVRSGVNCLADSKVRSTIFAALMYSSKEFDFKVDLCD